MKIIFWGKGHRGFTCLQALIEQGFEIDVVVNHPMPSDGAACPVGALAAKHHLKVISPHDPNDAETEAFLRQRKAEVFVLGGYGKILKKNILTLPQRTCINLHGGKLPEFRGSSPLNWALMRGLDSFTLSVIEVDAGVDTGNVLLERSFPISSEMTIRHLHEIANEHFPSLMIEVLHLIQSGQTTPRRQTEERAAYYPLRFPEDGFIVWDLMTARQIHDHIRALTEPYPCAFTSFQGERVLLLASEIPKETFYGEPGRVYRQSSSKGLLVCASDRCLWIKEARIASTGEPLSSKIRRYDRLATVRGFMLQQLAQGKASH